MAIRLENTNHWQAGYIAAPEPTEGQKPIQSLAFEFRKPMYQSGADRSLFQTNEPIDPWASIGDEAIVHFLYDHVRNWNFTGDGKWVRPFYCSEIANLPPFLFRRLLAIVLGMAKPDKNPSERQERPEPVFV